jgi:hypothetical protein
MKTPCVSAWLELSLTRWVERRAYARGRQGALMVLCWCWCTAGQAAEAEPLGLQRAGLCVLAGRGWADYRGLTTWGVNLCMGLRTVPGVTTVETVVGVATACHNRHCLACVLTSNHVIPRGGLEEAGCWR